MQLSRNRLMTVCMLVDVLQSRISFILPISFQLSMNYTLLTTELNRVKLQFGNFTLKNAKKTFKSRRGKAWVDVEKVPARPLKALPSFPQSTPTIMTLTAQKRSWYKLQSNRKQSCIKLRTTESFRPDFNQQLN